MIWVFHSSQENSGFRLPQGLCPVGAVSTIRRLQGTRNGYCYLIPQQYAIHGHDFHAL